MYLLILLNLIRVSVSYDCGKSITSPKTGSQHFPWIAEIYRTSDGQFKHLCGSTIVSSLFAVTAAHCIHEKHSTYMRSANDIFLMANVLDLKDFSESIKINVREIFINQFWNTENESYDGDIAIMKFSEPLNFNEMISPICLWTGSDDVDSFKSGTILTFIALEEDDPGYYNYQHNEHHNYPKLYNMPIRDNCTNIQKRFVPLASERTFCAGGLNSGPCLETGSSGSSMSVEFNQTFYLRGIVSASFIDFAGCDNYTFTLFTDALKYREWIDGILTLNLTNA